MVCHIHQAPTPCLPLNRSGGKQRIEAGAFVDVTKRQPNRPKLRQRNQKQQRHKHHKEHRRQQQQHMQHDDQRQQRHLVLEAVVPESAVAVRVEVVREHTVPPLGEGHRERTDAGHHVAHHRRLSLLLLLPDNLNKPGVLGLRQGTRRGMGMGLGDWMAKARILENIVSKKALPK